MEPSAYQKTIEFLYEIGRKGKPSVMNMQQLAQAIGNPQSKYKIIHVTGTNGKGTVSSQCASILQRSGYKTGLLTSPHIISLRERIKVNSQMLPENYITEKVSYLKEVSKRENLPMTFQLFVTALGFMYFQDQGVDWAVVEVACGGSRDLTNIVDPDISIITSVSLDHTHILGNTVEEIAIEKAGIIKPQKPVVIGPHTPKEVIMKIAEEKSSPLIAVEKNEDYETAQQENARISKAVFERLNKDGHNISEEAINWGMEVSAPLRVEKIRESPFPIILDIGHNPAAIERVYTDIKHMYPNKRIRAVFGFSMNRKPSEILPIVRSQVDYLHVVSTEHYRLYNHLDLIREANELGMDIDISGDLEEVFDSIFEKCSEEVLVIGGTFFIMEKVKECLVRNGVELEII